ncbi:nucleoside-diphosphate sugar epimerase/dehydratase [Listeria booriae]|uniref:polysaccharide biosynthesis protein n=1 Tax=Listeria booriae TaxID=1552123 RepID=UPI0028805CA0|nr:nucleoside-diphosphate sugar epimerase/dehydratase [Listeria booriae]MDT0112240.1 nucleoside-diphosphate sugar epimerase/dehydratase [Listeria booriae]
MKNIPSTRKKILIVGAGELGMNVLASFVKDYPEEYTLTGFLDDDRTKWDAVFHGYPVLGGLETLDELIRQWDIQMVVIAISDMDVEKRERIIQTGMARKVMVKSIPGIRELITQNDSFKALEEVTMQELLGRSQVKLDEALLTSQITGKTVLVTGAGGSIGSELCKQLLKLAPKKLIALGHGENSIYQLLMDRESEHIEPVIADVQDYDELHAVFAKYEPDIVYHAAAHKHVPLMERSLRSAFKNNFIGTKNVADMAEAFQVETCVMVSTDKAVNPVNNMGRTKRLAEMYIQTMATRATSCNFSVVRFGNVLGSRGSVIPLFKKQIKAGGPVTVTHCEMTRYFMTIPEAASLVLQAGSLAKSGDIYVLDMGESIKIMDLAQNLITLSGHSLEDIPIVEAGIRPGEKLHEELLDADEIYQEQISEKIHVGKTIPFDMKELIRLSEEYRQLTESELLEAVSGLTSKQIQRA